MAYNTWIVLVGAALLGANAGLVGSFAVLRRRALMGDALAHAALPGMCLAFIAVGQRQIVALQLGAFLSGVLGILVIAALRRWTRIKEDAAIGIVLSVFFGAGVVLVRLIQNRSTTGSKAGLDSYIYGKTAGMIAADVALIGTVSLACLVVVTLLYKEFKLIAFDPAFARAQGWRTFALDVLLMALIALTVVVGLPAVGVVLMAALLILPAAAARFWTQRLDHMLALATCFGLAIGAVGAGVSARFSGLPAGPMIVLVGTTLFLISLLAAPERGLVARTVIDMRSRRRLAEHQTFRAIFEVYEARGRTAFDFTPADLRPATGQSPARVRRALERCEQRGFVTRQPGDRFAWTNAGADEAVRTTQAYRLWDRFLAEQPDTAVQLIELDPLDVQSRMNSSLRQEFENALRHEGRWPVLAAEPGAEQNR